MLDIRRVDESARIPMPIPGVPDAQTRALDRRHRLDQQQRGFRAGFARSYEPSEGREVATVEE